MKELQKIEDKIIVLHNQQVILDSDVAEIYGVETKRINEAVKNNPDKFPERYVINLDDNEWSILRSKFSTAKYNKVRTLPKAFTEKGLYMLATILKSPMATEATIAIIETFAKVKELSRTMAEMSKETNQKQQKSMMQRGGELISDILSNDFHTVDTETSIELNLSVLKVKHTIKKKPNKIQRTER